MSKVKKGKRVAAAAMAVALSMATVTTGVLPNTTVHVHAEEDGSVYKKIADSSVNGFYYEQNVWGYIQCTTDKTLEYSSYDEMIKKLSAITKKIVQENAYDRYSFSFPIKISSAAKDERFENDQVNKDLENEVYKEETGDPKGGHTMASMGGGLTNIYDITYSESEKAYIGEVTGSGGYGSKKDRYDQTVKKLNEVIKNLNLDGKSDYEKFKAVTNWIVSNVTYDSHYNGKPNIPAGTEYPHDMTGAVLDKYAVCDGYAGLFYYMANAVGLKALYEDGTSISEQKGHAWNLVKMDGIYYYVDPTNAYFKEDGEPGSEVLHGQKYFFTLYAPDNTTIEDTYKNISQDDYLKEHSICKGKHKLGTAEKSKGATCTTAGYTSHKCTVPGCNYEEYEWIEPLGHEWSKEGTVTQEQSCENPEITTYKCERTDIWPACKATKQVETKPALGHTWDEGKITKEATCSETGVKTYTCSRCGGTKTEEIPKTKHDYEEHVVKAPTCTEKGISYYVCKNCRLTTSRRQTPATGHIHTEVRNQKDATYKEEGYTGDTYCKDCGKKLETGTVIPKLIETEHDYGEWVLDQAPTCKKYGARHRICKNCGDREVDVLDKVDHSWELVSTTPATCTIGEIQHYKCSVCGETKDVTLSNPLGEHSWDNGKVTKEATCTEDGEKTYTCTVCNTTKTEVIPATGHQHKEVRNAKKATCTEDGYTGDTYCTDCNTKLESGTVINKLGHTWDNGVITKEATETEEGVKTYTCKTCGETKTEKIPVTSHHWDQGTITKKATCTENGEKTYHCTDADCNKTYVETIPATGHQHTEIKDKKAATCEKDGYSGDTYCKDCGQLISKGAIVKATGHSWDSGKVTEAATCKKEGTKTYTCKNCGETKTESIPKTEHQWDNGKVTKEATCKEEGSKTYTCSICGDTKTEAIPKKEHSFDEGKITKKATCTEDGLKVYTCKSCGETKEEVLKATGHQHTELRNEKKATCTEEGYTGDTYCTDCGELIKKGSATEKADHNWKVTSEEKATCEKDGSKTYTCADCKETKTETIPATGHKFGDWQTVTTQSVFTGGVQKRICNVCGKEETRNVGNQLKATIKTNASSLKLKRKQATKKFVVSGLATGDSVKSWTSSNQKIVKVFGSRNGACTIKAGNKTGKAKITITLVSGLKKTINVTVQKNAVACTSIKNVPKKITLNAKKSYQLKPVINPITCTYKAKYKTSNKKIVKVTSRGKITAVKKGKAKITVMVGKKKFVCTVTIK
ncbi:transglutaminase domain-containing protein [Anaerostipes hadrus]|uniref:transglutaminase domain-containing protein n=1 Tax=Anaerostipes hadrus TaxID=649756 RepID=UPI00356974CF